MRSILTHIIWWIVSARKMKNKHRKRENETWRVSERLNEDGKREKL
jgi:hypothetical protein